MEPTITPEIVVAYSQCARKAYKLLYTEKQGTPHEYIAILEEEARKNRESHFKKIMGKNPDVVPYSPEGMKKGTSIMLDATLVSEDLQAYVDVLTGMEETASQRRHNYIPTLIVGTHKISKAQKLRLAFIGYVLSNLQKEKPKYGTIVGGGNTSHKTELETLYFDCLYGLTQSKLLYMSHFCDLVKRIRHRRSLPWKRDTPFAKANCLTNVRLSLRFSSRSSHAYTPS